MAIHNIYNMIGESLSVNAANFLQISHAVFHLRAVQCSLLCNIYCNIRIIVAVLM